ncbi:MAG: sulfotransferase [Myxococcota bacterium]|nr:sulfotransferase [Myxococcota bacterium]
MIKRVALTYGVLGRTFGTWLSPVFSFLLFCILRTLMFVGMLLDYVFFWRLWSKKVESPVVIVGTPRSGTTFLHRSLVKQGVGAGFQLYRMLFSSLVAQVLIKPFLPIMEKLSPARHHVAAAHKTSLVSVETDDVAVLFRYLDGFFLYGFFLSWDEADHKSLVDPRIRDTSARDYGWMEAIWRRNLVAHKSDRVVAKLFTLCMRLPSFQERFPDARIIYMVRDPVDVIPSTMSLMSGPLQAKFGFWDLEPALRERFLERLYQGLVDLYRGFHDDWTSERIDRDKVFLCPYPRLMGDYEALMTEMHTFLGEAPSEELAAQLKADAEAQRTRKSGHKYDLGKFGLDADRIRRDCAFVYETFLNDTVAAQGGQGE